MKIWSPLVTGLLFHCSTVAAQCPNPVTITFQNGTTFCQAPGSLLRAIGNVGNPNITYSWSYAPGPYNPYTIVGGNTDSLRVTASGYYTVRVRNTISNCADIASINVTVNPLPALPAATASGPVCPGDTLHLAAVSITPGATYSWAGPNGFTSALQNPDVLNMAPMLAGSYTVKALLNGCSSAADTVAVAISCLDSLWPGDANYDHIADNNDILQIALGYNTTGPVRTAPSINWVPQYCYNWQTTIGGINTKHADCNGDGLISFSDTASVTANYGLIHLRGRRPLRKGAGLPELYFDLANTALAPGTTVSIPIRLGSAGLMMQGVAGIASKISVSGIMPAGSLSIDYSGSGLGTAGNTLRYARTVTSSGIDWACGRTDHQMVNTAGTIANLLLKLPAHIQGQ